MYKVKKGETSQHHLLKDSGVMLYNIHEEKPMKDYNINYSFYLGQINKRIVEIERGKQLTLF